MGETQVRLELTKSVLANAENLFPRLDLNDAAKLLNSDLDCLNTQETFTLFAKAVSLAVRNLVNELEKVVYNE